jgi:hypothetical protein
MILDALQKAQAIAERSYKSKKKQNKTKEQSHYMHMDLEVEARDA